LSEGPTWANGEAVKTANAAATKYCKTVKIFTWFAPAQ
jgi:hypothetical protein